MSDMKQKPSRRFPQEYPDHPERYTEEFVAIDHIELADSSQSGGLPRMSAVGITLGGPLELEQQLGLQNAGETFSDCHRQSRRQPWSEKEQEAHDTSVRQDSDYHTGDKAAPDNNIFFEERSNPLSSKGN